MYDLLLMFFSLFSQSYFSFLVSFMLSYIFWAFHIVFCLPVQCNLCDVAPGAQAFFLFSILTSKSNAHFCYYYLFTFRAFFLSISFFLRISKPHLLSSTAHTVVIHLTRNENCRVEYLFSTLFDILLFSILQPFFLCWHKLALFFHIHFQINATKAYLFYNLLRIV